MAEVNDTQGTRLRRNGTVIPAVYEIGVIDVGRALRDVTSLSDTVHKHKMNIPDLAEIECKLWYDSQEPLHRVLFSDHAGASLGSWQIDLEQGNSPEENVTFTAYVSKCALDPQSVDGDLSLSFSLKPQSIFVGLFDQ
jgi:hypothetical protein